MTVPTPTMLRGTGVVPGLAFAPVAWNRERLATLPAPVTIPEDEREDEATRLRDAAEAVAARLEERASHATGVGSELLATTAALARDRGWQKAARRLVAQGTPATHATMAAIAQFVSAFEKLGGRTAERTTDLRDVRDRIVAELLGAPEPGVPHSDRPVVLLADDLSPADTAGLDPRTVTALVTRLGGPTSHTAIIARQLGIPCVVAVADLQRVAEDEWVLVDGTTGVITLDADPTEAERELAGDRRRRDRVAAWRGPARTLDAVEVEVLANVQDGPSAVLAAGGGAAGVGLLRTELAFFHADREPSVEEQAARYGDVLDAFGDRKVVIRTLDAGSDKPLPFARVPAEENPALGVRGVRMADRIAGLLTRQLDAIARAAAARPGRPAPWVMAPMVATLAEARWFAAECRERGLPPGIMVEVPAVAVLAERFLAHVDFLSIGTNDLAQYTMAADRLSPHLSSFTDPWQPAVLSLVAATARAGIAAGRPVGVCGEAAADPLLACVLVGMGCTSLSMAAPAIPQVGVQLAEVTLEQCRRAADAALAADDAAGARDAALRALS